MPSVQSLPPAGQQATNHAASSSRESSGNISATTGTDCDHPLVTARAGSKGDVGAKPGVDAAVQGQHQSAQIGNSHCQPSANAAATMLSQSIPSGLTDTTAKSHQASYDMRQSSFCSDAKPLMQPDCMHIADGSMHEDQCSPGCHPGRQHSTPALKGQKAQGHSTEAQSTDGKNTGGQIAEQSAGIQNAQQNAEGQSAEGQNAKGEIAIAQSTAGHSAERQITEKQGSEGSSAEGSSVMRQPPHKVEYTGLHRSKALPPSQQPEGNAVANDTDLDRMFEFQVQHIKESAVMLPEPAEVLVTDLLDYR